MKDWEEFEQNATEFLQRLSPDFIFRNIGNKVSNAPDIEVLNLQNHKIFNIEAKYTPSQAGQIVVLDNNGVFQYSTKSKNIEVQATSILIEHLNINYSTYVDVSQSAIPISIHEDILYSFIEEQYRIKNNEWIIASNRTSSLTSTSVCLIPISEIRNNFFVSAVLRRKKSGTSEVPKFMRDRAREIVSSIFHAPKFEEDGKKIYFYGDIGHHPLQLPENLYLSEKGMNKYEIRKRSNTNNANIMFSLELKPAYLCMKDRFLTELNSFN